MATELPLTSLPAICERDSLALDAKVASSKINEPQDSRIERYLESTEIHLGKVLQWDVSGDADPFGKGVRSARSSHGTAGDTVLKQSMLEQRNYRARSRTEPGISSSFPPTKRASNDGKLRAWTGNHSEKNTQWNKHNSNNNTWPKCGTNSDFSSNREITSDTETFGQLHRANLDFMARQSKQAEKLSHDNMAAKETLRRAEEVIQELRAKINRRTTHIKDRREKEGNLVELVESLRRARDEKLQEYKSLVKGMNEALKEKEKLLEQMETERAKAEMLYQRQLTQNTELLRKIEAREKAIKTLREKTGKVKKWKDEARS